jgi:hypothetical protein
VEQELLTFPENLSSPPVFSRVRVAQSLVFVDVLVDIPNACRDIIVLYVSDT